MDILEITGTALGLLFLWLEYKASPWLWIPSIAMPAVYIPIFFSTRLYADLALSVYYILASIYGLICWLRHTGQDKSSGNTSGITETPKDRYIHLAAAGLLLNIAIGSALSSFTDSNTPWADAFTTAWSIVAMYMLAKKYIQQWLLWIIVDIASAALYIYKDLNYTAALYTLYAIIATAGYMKWKQLMKKTPEKAWTKTQ